MRLAIIPARGGSERIPRKNIKPFGGVPIIAWGIRAAIESRCFDRIIVSTDDDEIAEVAKRHGAEVPFMRPTALSDNHTGTIPVIAHAIDWQNRNGEAATDVCCIYATSPFIRSSDLVSGLDILHRAEADYAFTVTSYPYPIQRAIRIKPEQRVEMFQPEHFNTRSQDLEVAWHDAGQFYWGRASAWLSGQQIFGKKSAPIHLPRFLVHDLDNEQDWLEAEVLFDYIRPKMSST